jgi:hypothetical protein
LSKELIEENPTQKNRYAFYHSPYGLSKELIEENPTQKNRYAFYHSPYGFLR